MRRDALASAADLGRHACGEHLLGHDAELLLHRLEVRELRHPPHPERVVGAPAPGGDVAGFGPPLERLLHHLGIEGEDRHVAELTRELREMGERVAEDPSQMLGEDWALDEADRAVSHAVAVTNRTWARVNDALGSFGL